MENILIFDTYGEGKTTIAFGIDYVRFEINGDKPSQCLIYYESVRNFEVKTLGNLTTVTFYGKNFKEKTYQKDKVRDYYSAYLCNNNGEIDFVRIFEDRTPLRTHNSKMEELMVAYDLKMQNSPTDAFGNIYLKISRLRCFSFIIDGIQKVSSSSLQYVDGCRVLTLPVNKWDICIKGGDAESGNDFLTNSLTFDFYNEPRNQYVKLQSHWFTSPDFIKIQNPYDV